MAIRRLRGGQINILTAQYASVAFVQRKNWPRLFFGAVGKSCGKAQKGEPKILEKRQDPAVDAT